MLVTPLPGTNRQDLRQTIHELHTAAINIRGGSARPGDVGHIDAYFRWTDWAIGLLTGQIAERDIQRLILTRRYWALLESPSIGTPQYYAVLDREIDQRISQFDETYRELDAQIGRWSDLDTYVVPDTSFFVKASRCSIKPTITRSLI
jgi:hypothetical protein